MPQRTTIISIILLYEVILLNVGDVTRWFGPLIHHFRRYLRSTITKDNDITIPWTLFFMQPCKSNVGIMPSPYCEEVKVDDLLILQQNMAVPWVPFAGLLGLFG